jgi:SAM-dependent methyltransferase
MANENINNSYFDGYYKDIWRSIIPTGLTERETEFMIQYFQLSPGTKVLDLMCGYGRHTLALARQGIEVIAVDNLGDYINEISSVIKQEKLPAKAIKADIIQFRSDESFDLAICMGNSLNFFNEAEILTLLSSVSSRLNKGGQLLINTWSLAEIAIKQFIEKSWSMINGLKYLSDSAYLFHPTRIETETTIISPEGDTEVKQAIDYIFSVAEMEKLLTASGFILKEIYSIPGRKKFQVGEPRAYIVAVKK